MNIITENAYLVLSVNDCKALLATARRSQKASNNRRGSHSVVLHNVRVLQDSAGAFQISSASVAIASRDICEKASQRIASNIRTNIELSGTP